MAKTKAKKQSGMSFPLLLLELIALAGLVVGVMLLISKLQKDGESTEALRHEITMQVGDQKTLEATLKNAYSCASSDETIVSVDEATRLLTARAAGQATVTATDSVSGGSEFFVITVQDNPDHPGAVVTETTTEVTTTTSETTTTTSTAPEGVVSGIALSYYQANVKVGEVHPYALVTMSPADAKDKSEIWTSSDESVATVDRAGRITGIKPGKCVIRVTAAANQYIFAEIDVTVVDANGNSGEVTSTPDTNTPSDQTRTTVTPTAQSPAEVEIRTVNGITYVNGILIANKTYGLPETYSPGVDPAAQAAFNEMQAAAAKDGMSLKICSGFRDYALQKQLYNSYVTRDGKAAADRYSARPGHSEHQTGLAFDINRASSVFTGTKEAKWLAENCWKYGFILRYPEGKEDVTGYMYESWHIRYLGKEWAKTITESGLTLEEYFGLTSVYAD